MEIVAGGDFNGDGKSDLMWHNQRPGQVYLWTMNGGAITGTFLVSTVPDLNWRIIASGDFNANARADLLWHNRSTGQAYVWLMNGASIVTVATPGTVGDLNWGLQALR